MRNRERDESRGSRMTFGLAEGTGDPLGGVGSPAEYREGSDGARGGVEAYVARAEGSHDTPYAPEWDTDETLEAYIARG